MRLTRCALVTGVQTCALPIYGARVRRWRDLLHAGLRREPLAPAWCANWDGKQPLALPGGGQLQLDGAGTFDAPLRVHARHGGERIRLPGRDHSHALKHVLQDLGVPPWQRSEEHTSELQSLMRISYAVFCLKKKN